MTRSARARRNGRAFTLVELMVALVAGVIIAIAVIGLARAATTTFYEQARVTSVEQNVRNAANRLRYDLTRVSYMGIGNIHLANTEDALTRFTPRAIPKGLRVGAVSTDIGIAGLKYGVESRDIQGIRVLVSGSTSDANVVNYAAAPNFTSPDGIEIMGNLTTDDMYVGTWNTTGGSCGGGTFVADAAYDPATKRLIGDATTADANVKNAFTPGPAGTEYFARVVDSLGCLQVVKVKDAVGTATGFTLNLCPGQGGALVTTSEDLTNGLTMAAGNCGVDVRVGARNLRISPLHRVRWRIATNTIAALDPPTTIAPVGSTFMLYRELLDTARNVVPGMAQVVAEYAVDLKFGIAVDARETNLPPNNVLVFDLDSDTGGVNGGGPIDSWTRPASTSALTVGNPTQPGPQRVRSVKFRVSTRTSLPDRDRPLALLPNSPYVSRYCLDMPACTKFARVRTIVSEVPLINQARMMY